MEGHLIGSIPQNQKLSLEKSFTFENDVTLKRQYHQNFVLFLENNVEDDGN